MTNGHVQHMTVEESTIIQWVKTVAGNIVYFMGKEESENKHEILCLCSELRISLHLIGMNFIH